MLFTTTAACYNFVEFVHVKYKQRLAESLVARSLNLWNTTFKSEYCLFELHYTKKVKDI